MKHAVGTLAQDASSNSPAASSTSGGGEQAPRIRSARAADIPALAKVAARAYRASFSDVLGDAALKRADAAAFAARFSPRLEQLIVAESDARAIGFALVAGEALAMLFVDAASAGGGVGSALLSAAEARGAGRLETFRANESARRFYERRGWRLALLYRRPFLGRAYAFAGYVKP